MNSTLSRIAALVAMAAVIVYTLYNYYTGRSSIGFVIAALLVIGLPMMNIIKLMLRDKDDS